MQMPDLELPDFTSLDLGQAQVTAGQKMVCNKKFWVKSNLEATPSVGGAIEGLFISSSSVK